MKVSEVKPFTPITITLESEGELVLLTKLLSQFTSNMAKSFGTETYTTYNFLEDRCNDFGIDISSYPEVNVSVAKQ